MSVRHRKVLIPILLVAILIVATSVFITAQQPSASEDASFRKALEVITLIKLHYVEPVSIVDLTREYVAGGSIQALMRAVNDPYSRYLNAKSYSEMQVDTSGEFGGIGIYMGMRDDRITVIAPIEGTPAARAGIKAGDFIATIDGKSTEGMSSEQAQNLMRGPKGTKVIIGVERGPDLEYIEFEIIREIIQVPSVEGRMLEDGIGYLQVASFTGTTMQGLHTKLAELEQQGMQGLILDLRFNPGGLLTAAIEMVDEFVSEGPILHVAGRNGAGRQTISATKRTGYPDLPLIVLVNKGSASASEIVAGALKDLGRATLIGTQTFGKGSVQTIFPLHDGSGLVLTTQKWYSSGGQSIHLQGIEPNIILYNPGDEKMEAHLKQMQAEQNGLRSSEEEQAAEETSEAAESEAAAEEPFEDLQLQKAIEVLRAQINSARKAA